MNNLKSMIHQLKQEIREERDFEIKLYIQMKRQKIQEKLEETFFINEKEIIEAEAKLNILWELENFIEKGESCEQEEMEV